MRHLIMQRLLGVRGAQLKTGRSYGQKNPKQVFREQVPQDLELGQSECSAREVSGGARPMGTESSPGGHFGVEMGVLSGLWRPWVDSPRVETRAKSCWAT